MTTKKDGKTGDIAQTSGQTGRRLRWRRVDVYHIASVEPDAGYRISKAGRDVEIFTAWAPRVFPLVPVRLLTTTDKQAAVNACNDHADKVRQAGAERG